MAYPLTVAAPCSTVELSFSAKNLKNCDILSKSDPVVIVYEETSRDVWSERGRTETIQNCLSPEWNTRVTVTYHFERRQRMRFEVYDIDSNSSNLSDHDFIGRVICDLAEVVAAPGGTHTAQLNGASGKLGTLSVHCEETTAQGSHEVLRITLAAKIKKKGMLGALIKPDPFLQIYRVNEDGSRSLAYRSETRASTSEPQWNEFEVNLRQLCNGDRDCEFIIECLRHYNSGSCDGRDFSHRLIGSARTSVNSLLKTTDMALVHEEKRAKRGASYASPGDLRVVRQEVVKTYSFLDFIAGGTQLDFSVAVDFTGSNGVVTSPDSLHYINTALPNQYESAISSVLDICQHYNNSKKFDAFGFGAILPPTRVVSHVFNLNLEARPTIVGVNGVMEAYRKSLTKVDLYGPTYFSPVIDEVTKKVATTNKHDGSRYHIMLIITDGAINDMAKTTMKIIDASQQPISLIIVGVGDADFSSMDELDADGKLLSYGGRIAARDIVQFVPFSKFLPPGTQQSIDSRRRAMELLAAEVLAEVPAQLTGYMRRNNIQPRPANDPFPRDSEAVAPGPSPYPEPAFPYPYQNGPPPPTGYRPATDQGFDYRGTSYGPVPGFQPPGPAHPGPAYPAAGYPPAQPGYPMPYPVGGVCGPEPPPPYQPPVEHSKPAASAPPEQ